MSQGRKQQRRRLALITALSAAVHVAVLALIGLNAPGVRDRPPVPYEPFEVSLVTPQLRPRPPAERPEGEPMPGPLGRQVPAPPTPVSPLAPPAHLAPSALPAPSVGPATPAPGGGGGSGRAATQFPNPQAEARRVLRGTYGCAYADDLGLNRREREACYDRYGKGPMAPLDATIPGDKRQRWDRTAAKQKADRDYRENPTVPVGTAEEQGPGRPAGVGPASPLNAPIKTPF